MEDWRAVLDMPDDPTAGNCGEVQSSEESNVSSLNFKVAADFKREFKGYAVSRGITMIELLKEGFALSKQRRGQ